MRADRQSFNSRQIRRYLKVHEVNVVGVLRVTQAFLPALRASKGRVVNIGSIAGIVAIPGRGRLAGFAPGVFFFC